MKIRLPALLLAALLLLCACTGAEAVPAAGGAPTAAQPSPAVTAELPEDIPGELLETLNKRLNNQTFACAMYYIDLTTGLTISYNADRQFAAASLIKAPYLMYILDMIAAGELSLDDVHTYRRAYHYIGGTGQIRYMEDGTQLTLRQIIEYIVYDSDNVAFKMLNNGYDGVLSIPAFHDMAMRDYDAPYYSGTYGNVLTASGVGRMFAEIYARAERGDELYVWFVDMLKDANENKFVKGGLPTDENGECLYEVAHKYGMDIKSSNDAAIVFYNDRPYVLVLLTDYLLINTQGFMNRVSADVFAIHEYICDSSRWQN
ncbi:MAG TPA: class A beta-lactamase-related serine hydrolase [Firmicutes bacterium]|nr:class A beta-lactamase-related serine hydrolase [Bacillota bacterium]